MAEAYTIFWTRERCDTLRRLGWTGHQLEVLFGGPHISEPSFRDAKVQRGDEIYPIAVRSGVLYILGRVRVRQILDLEKYIEKRRDLFATYLSESPTWILNQGYKYVSPSHVLTAAFDLYREAHPEIRALAPTCTYEVLECDDSTPLRFDVAVPPDMLLRLRYRSRRKERDLHKHIRDGRLMQSLGVQGIYRLSEASASEFSALVQSVLAPATT